MKRLVDVHQYVRLESYVRTEQSGVSWSLPILPMGQRCELYID